MKQGNRPLASLNLRTDIRTALLLFNAKVNKIIIRAAYYKIH